MVRHREKVVIKDNSSHANLIESLQQRKSTRYQDKNGKAPSKKQSGISKPGNNNPIRNVEQSDSESGKSSPVVGNKIKHAFVSTSRRKKTSN